jgi:hypothetical protein
VGHILTYTDRPMRLGPLLSGFLSLFFFLSLWYILVERSTAMAVSPFCSFISHYKLWQPANHVFLVVVAWVLLGGVGCFSYTALFCYTTEFFDTCIWILPACTLWHSFLSLFCALGGRCITSATYVDLAVSEYDERQAQYCICLKAGWGGIRLVEHI